MRSKNITGMTQVPAGKQGTSRQNQLDDSSL